MIFITAYEEYAVRAFDEGAIDYLQKPVARDRLARTVERVRTRLETESPLDMAALLTLLQSRLTPGQSTGHQVDHREHRQLGQDVLYRRGAVLPGRGQVHASRDGEVKATSARSLKELLPALDSGNVLAGTSQRDRARRRHPQRGKG